MTNDRLSSMALMKIHRTFLLDVKKVDEDFIAMNPKRCLNKTLLD